MGVRCPQRGGAGVPVPQAPRGVVQGVGTALDLGQDRSVVGDMAVEVHRQLGGGTVVDGPQGTDDMSMARELERGRDVERFAGQSGGGDAGFAGGQVGKRDVQMKVADVRDGGRVSRLRPASVSSASAWQVKWAIWCPCRASRTLSRVGSASR